MMHHSINLALLLSLTHIATIFLCPISPRSQQPVSLTVLLAGLEVCSEIQETFSSSTILLLPSPQLSIRTKHLPKLSMATPPSCPGLHVEILVNGQLLQEYDDSDESSVPPNTITKYIEARSDVNFAVRVSFDKGFL
jgi:hypothetical protein